MEDFERRHTGEQVKNPDGPKWTGIILILVGLAFLMRNILPEFPRWIFRWEMILISIGLIVGIRHQFRGAGWFIMVAIGGISMLDLIFPVFNKPQFTWATIAIVTGLYLILRPGTKSGGDSFTSGAHTWSQDTSEWSQGASEWSQGTSSFGKREYVSGEVLNTTSIFGSVKKVVVSKSFRGGEIVAIMGGAEIDLSKADISGRARLNATNIMGGTELIVPSDWNVQSNVVAVLGGVEDKRDPRFLRIEPGKILVLEGVCLLGGIEIKSY